MTKRVCEKEESKFDLIRLSPGQIRRNIKKGDFDAAPQEVIYSRIFERPSRQLWDDVDPQDSLLFVRETGRLDRSFPFKGLEGKNAFLRLTVEGRARLYLNKDQSLDSPRAEEIKETAPLFIHSRHFSMSLEACKRGDEKKCAQRAADSFFVSAALFSKEEQILAGRARIVSVTYGDYNGDGLTDLLLGLSDDSALILQQKEKAESHFSCREIPWPPPPLR